MPQRRPGVAREPHPVLRRLGRRRVAVPGTATGGRARGPGPCMPRASMSARLLIPFLAVLAGTAAADPDVLDQKVGSDCSVGGRRLYGNREE